MHRPLQAVLEKEGKGVSLWGANSWNQMYNWALTDSALMLPRGTPHFKLFQTEPNNLAYCCLSVFSGSTPVFRSQRHVRQQCRFLQASGPLITRLAVRSGVSPHVKVCLGKTLNPKLLQMVGKYLLPSLLARVKEKYIVKPFEYHKGRPFSKLHVRHADFPFRHWCSSLSPPLLKDATTMLPISSHT